MKYFDAHCHLPTESEIAHARDTGVVGMICNATCQREWGAVIGLTQSNPVVFGAIGIHPWFIDDLSDDWAYHLRDILIANPELMIGEIGLDRSKPNIEHQVSVFEQQLLIAHDLGRAVHLHCVRAWDLIFRILKKNKNNLPPLFVAHEYSGTPTDISKLASDYNFYFSYGVRALTGGAHAVARIQSTPYDRILVESDSDKPSMVVDVAKRVAKIANITTEQIYTNAKQVFIND